MKLIELHWDDKPYSVNVNYIVAVVPRQGLTEIFTVGDKAGDALNAEEPYEEVLRLIKEASDGD